MLVIFGLGVRRRIWGEVDGLAIVQSRVEEIDDESVEIEGDDSERVTNDEG
jgi:hypothetical protein